MKSNDQLVLQREKEMLEMRLDAYRTRHSEITIN